MSLRVTDLSARLLAYRDLLIGSTMPTGATLWLVDAIGGAIGEMLAAAPALFHWGKGGVFRAPATVGVTVDASLNNTLAVATNGIIPGFGCTLRIGALQDFTVQSYVHPVCVISPGYQGTLGSVLTATVWHDAFAVPSIRVNDRTTVLINGHVADRVANREQAMRGQLDIVPTVAAPGVSWTQRTQTGPNDWPRFWWLERDIATAGGPEYLCVYPMPAVAMALEIKGTWQVSDLSPSTVLTDTTSFGLNERLAQDVWLPLAVKRWRACPLMANINCGPEIEVQSVKALEILASTLPKAPSIPGWNELPGPGYRRGWRREHLG